MSFNLTDNSKEFTDELEKKAVIALESVGLTAEGYAKLNSPVDTGRLRNSITHVVKNNAAVIGTNVEYAKYVEFGTKRQKASHYLKRAIDDNMQEYKQIIEDTLKA